jgi:hypothetical protein
MKISILVIISICMASFQLYARQEPSRIETRNFADLTAIHFDHIYGHITVTESASNQVELEIQYFDDDNVKPVCETTISGKVLTIKTTIDFPRNSRNNSKIGIDYIIALPKNLSMDIRLKYGNVNMGDYYGDLKCNLSYSNINMGDCHGSFQCDIAYGNLNANTLFKSPVAITGKYSNVNIGHVDVLNLSIAYGNVGIKTMQTMTINSKYSKCKINKIDVLDANCSYGGFNIGSVIDFVAELRYTPVTIDHLEKSFKLSCAYSNIKIENSSPALQSVQFDGSYSNFRLGLDGNLSANLDVELKYGNLSVEDLEVKYSFSEKDYKQITKNGVIGNKTPTASIRIRDTYDSVKIFESNSK